MSLNSGGEDHHRLGLNEQNQLSYWSNQVDMFSSHFIKQ